MKKFLIPSLLFISSITLAQQQKPLPNSEKMLGCWKTEKDAQEHMLLTRDHKFNFSDYNSKTGSYETITGTWKIIKRLDKLVLQYDDRPKQEFTIRIDKTGNYRLTKAGGFEFIKAQPSECK